MSRKRSRNQTSSRAPGKLRNELIKLVLFSNEFYRRKQIDVPRKRLQLAGLSRKGSRIEEPNIKQGTRKY